MILPAQSVPSSLETLKEISLEDVLNKLGQQDSAPQREKIQCAYEIAERSHNEKKRMSGVPYISHPLNVAYILAQLGMDEETICAGLLHDTVEDSELWIEYIAAACGEDVCHLVDGLTKIASLHVASSQESQMENMRRMLLFTARDIRVIVVKLADRLHNMRTLQYLPAEKRKRIAEVTLDIYAPLAHLIGMGCIKWELEDLAFQFLQPDIYEKIKNAVAERRSEREDMLDSFCQQMSRRLQELSIPCSVMGRAKHFYSIYQKMRKTGREPHQLHDLLAVRVITSSVENCYLTLGAVHQLYRPVEGRMKDYIANHKANGYQSLHTTVRIDDRREVEVQIRTEQMHLVAEEGVAAHWRYKKQGHSTHDEEDHKRLMRQIKGLLQDTEETADPEEFFATMRSDLLSDEIYVTTPKNKIIRLPKGATPIDFAYKIHTEIGDHFTGAKVDSKFVGRTYELQTGQTVEIATSPRAHPSPDWLAIVKTGRARTKIRRYLLQQKRERLLTLGKSALTQKLEQMGWEPNAFYGSPAMEELTQRYGCKAVDDLFVAIGYGRVSVKQIQNYLEPPKKQKTKSEPPAQDKAIIQPGQMDGVLYRRARCCHPVPGEPITGVVTRSRGITIHRSDCPNIVGFRGDQNRLLQLYWDTDDTERFDVVIDIGAKDREALLADVSGVISAAGINMTNCRTVSTGAMASLVFTLEIHNATQLRDVMSSIEGVDGVRSVLRRRRRSTGNGKSEEKPQKGSRKRERKVQAAVASASSAKKGKK